MALRSPSSGLRAPPAGTGGARGLSDGRHINRPGRLAARAAVAETAGMNLVTRPLDGITVVALEHAVAAPFATRQLADLGARVIKIERPNVGDFARDYDATVKGMASHFVWLNRSKESLTLDLKHPEARQIVHQLLADADVF